ncbi:MAG: TIGR03032 family protein [Planctomycetaceae bacterium]|nr:TIGR03032 family protein [Planctomycetaceae bacterium]
MSETYPSRSQAQLESAPHTSSASEASQAPPGAARQPPPQPPPPVAFHYAQTDSFAALLNQLGASLLVSTYQANKLLAVRASGPGLSTLVRTFDKPMGLAVDGARLAIGTRKEVWFLRNAPDIAPRVEPVGMHDACFLPRASHVTGEIGIHEVAWAENRSQDPGASSQPELWIVSTRFSCLCTLHADYSFVPRWRPPFITALAAEDRCHLNGLAMVDGRPAFVSALGTTDIADGWRADKPRGGCIIDIASGEFVCHGLSMPHSPRWHDRRLLVLESGTGSLAVVDRSSGRRETVVELPGFTRGLALAGNYAFVGLSKIRATSAMDGVPIASRRDELKCGVAAVDLRSGRLAGMLEFQTAVEEIFDVQLLPGIRFPEVMGFQKDSLQHTFIIPPEGH